MHTGFYRFCLRFCGLRSYLDFLRTPATTAHICWSHSGFTADGYVTAHILHYNFRTIPFTTVLDVHLVLLFTFIYGRLLRCRLLHLVLILRHLRYRLRYTFSLRFAFAYATPRTRSASLPRYGIILTRLRLFGSSVCVLPALRFTCHHLPILRAAHWPRLTTHTYVPVYVLRTTVLICAPTTALGC